MRVISQDGTMDVPYEVSSLNMVVGKYEDVVNAAIYCCNSFSTIRMAEYGSEEKAKKAMERLRKIYENNVFYHCTAGSKRFEEAQSILSVEQFQKATSEYFQFPTEKELE